MQKKIFFLRNLRKTLFVPQKNVKFTLESEESDEDDGNYLHPSLMASSSKSITSSPSSWPSEPSTYKIGEEHDQYSDLYNRLAVFMPKPAEIKISEEPEASFNNFYGFTSSGRESIIDLPQ